MFLDVFVTLNYQIIQDLQKPQGMDFESLQIGEIVQIILQDGCLLNHEWFSIKAYYLMHKM